MSYIKNALIIFMLCYYNFLLNDDSKKLLKSLVAKTLNKHRDSIEQINDLIELSLLEPSGIRKDRIDFEEKTNILYENIKKIDSKELEKDINFIMKKIRNIKSKK